MRRRQFVRLSGLAGLGAMAPGGSVARPGVGTIRPFGRPGARVSPSPYHGLNLCVGTTAEMLQYPGREIHDVIRYFGERQRIFNMRGRHGHGGSVVKVVEK